MTGIYREIVAPERLVYSSCALDKNGKALFEVLQTVTFIAEGGKTRLRVAIQIISTTPAGAPYLQGQREGWSQSLERLATYIDKSKDILMSTHSTKHATFVIERTFDFAPKVVFAAWADAEAKSRWFAGPDDWKQLHRELDFQVGGREHVRGGQPGARISTFEARYYDIVPNARIVYAYEMHLDDVKISVSLATIEFNAEDPGTRLIVTEQGVFLDGYDDAGSREHGTRGLLDRLGDALQRIAAA